MSTRQAGRKSGYPERPGVYSPNLQVRTGVWDVGCGRLRDVIDRKRKKRWKGEDWI
jgi:hypothetical protein